jgi:hypothetical protein
MKYNKEVLDSCVCVCVYVCVCVCVCIAGNQTQALCKLYKCSTTKLHSQS